MSESASRPACDAEGRPYPDEAASADPEILRAALIREWEARRRAECSATMQTEVVKLALDLLVREPDIEGFFACLAGSCPLLPCTNSADFDQDGDTGTDADIEAFFRVLAGGNC